MNYEYTYLCISALYNASAVHIAIVLTIITGIFNDPPTEI